MRTSANTEFLRFLMRGALAAVLLLVLPSPMRSQSFHWSIKAGIPLTDYFQTTHSPVPREAYYTSATNRYTVGPAVEVSLPMRMGLEVDLLYKRLHFSGFRAGQSRPGVPSDTIVHGKTSANSWELPVLLKYRAATDLPVGTFLEAGVSIQRVTNVRRSFAVAPLVLAPIRFGPPIAVTTAEVDESLVHPGNVGLVTGGGIEFQVKSIGISPGFRSTFWRYRNFRSRSAYTPNGLLDSSQTQIEFLLGIRLRSESH